jgi:Cu/Ag efflux pump CusA
VLTNAIGARIIISAYLPLFMLEREERRLFTPMALTICFAWFGSSPLGPRRVGFG